MKDNLIGLQAWNFSITTALRGILYVKTNNGIIPTDKVNERVNKAMEYLEEFEHVKHVTIIHQLSKHALVCKKEADSIKGWQFWKWRRLRLLWCSYSVYQNAMAIVLDTLPTDTRALMQPPPESSTEEVSGVPASPVADSPLKIVRDSQPENDNHG